MDKNKLYCWEIIPSINLIIKTLLLELKTQKYMIRFTDNFKNACQLIIQIPDLLNILLKLLFERTNIYKESDIITCFNFLDQWFNFLIKKNKSLLQKFDYKYFQVGV